MKGNARSPLVSSQGRFIIFCHFVSLDGCSQFSAASNYFCLGGNITYTCVLNSSAATVITAWSGSAFQCPPTNKLSLIQMLTGSLDSNAVGSCGNYSAVTTNVTSTCYTSVLTVPAVQALNGTTVVCQDGISGAVVGSDTVILASEFK